MANISVRKIDEELIARLRIRANQHGVSMEEEVRQIIKQAVSDSDRIGDMALQYFGEQFGAQLELPQHLPHEPLDLST
jgi:plasmid stability protein